MFHEDKLVPTSIICVSAHIDLTRLAFEKALPEFSQVRCQPDFIPFEIAIKPIEKAQTGGSRLQT